MKEDIIIYVNSKTSMIDKNQSVIGISNENIVSNIIFKFEDGFVDGTARLELIKPDETKGMILMNKEEESYTLPIKSSLLDQEGKLYLQLRITKEKEGEEIPIFKSKMFYLVVNESINAEEEIPEQYPTWIEIFDEKIAEINSKIEEVDNIDISQERVEDGVEITITSKDGSSTIEKVYDGEKGEKGEQGEQGIQGIDGKDAVINGVNTLNIIEGEGIKLEQIGSNLKITSTGGYDDTEIRQEIDEIQEEVSQLDRDITNVDNRVTALGEELQEQELTLNHLDDVKADKTEIPDITDYYTKEQSDERYLTHIPEDIVIDEDYVHTDNNFTTEEKEKLADLENYVLPPSSTTELGGVKVGNNLTVDEDGTLNAEAGVEKDDITIVENELGQIQAHGVIEQNNGNASKTWIGTQAEYENLSTKDLDTLYYITDGEDLYATIEYVDDAIKNSITSELESDF